MSNYNRGLDALGTPPHRQAAPKTVLGGVLFYGPNDAAAGGLAVDQMKKAFVQAKPATRAMYATATANISQGYDALVATSKTWTGYVDPSRYKDFALLGQQAATLTDQMRHADGLPSMPSPNIDKGWSVPTWAWWLGGGVLAVSLLGFVVVPVVMPLLVAKVGAHRTIEHKQS